MAMRLQFTARAAEGAFPNLTIIHGYGDGGEEVGVDSDIDGASGVSASLAREILAPSSATLTQPERPSTQEI